MKGWKLVATLAALIGCARTGQITMQAPLQASFSTAFAGVDTEQSSIWEGHLGGPDGGTVRLALRQVEGPDAAANLVWHVWTRWQVEPGADSQAFIAELAGTVNWKDGTAHLSGVITSGWKKGAWIQVETSFVQGDAQGTLRVIETGFVATATAGTAGGQGIASIIERL
jgi:hypothetical protein